MSVRVPLILSLIVIVASGAGLLSPAGDAVPLNPLNPVPGVTPEIALEPVVTGLAAMTYATTAGDGSDRMFLVEQRGTVRLLQDGELHSGFWLDIRDRVNSAGFERGLFALAFHPDFSDNGRVLASYTGAGGASVISEFTVADPATGKPDPESERIIITVAQPFSNHNGGLIKFGPDGYLYTSLGDGGSGGDPLNNGQRLDTLLGAMLRIDVDVPSGYAIPDDNPFLGDPEARDEIWSYGLRNPWRWSFDRATGDLYIADVGQNTYEEVNFEPAAHPGGANYGWRAWEAFNMYDSSQALSADTATMTFPIISYPTGFNCSITGGYVYRGDAIPDLDGWYLYSDWCSGTVWGAVTTPVVGVSFTLLDNNFRVSSFAEDDDGELYIVSHNGGLYRVISG